ncbi:hypothetical protein ACIA8K_25540 [Catenuloplanes sp. NPDC051500]|uniref:hypothetical protein n=1 Tax=Catenuloplanes sp. NPDC051500 TaxID=3363959 RepID=UPI0037B027AB
MGSALASTALATGHTVTVWNRDPTRALPFTGAAPVSCTAPRWSRPRASPQASSRGSPRRSSPR